MENHTLIHSMKHYGKKRAASFVISAVMSISASMTAVTGAVLRANAENAALMNKISVNVDELLSCREYVEGNAIVTVYKGTDILKYRNNLVPKNSVSSKARSLLKNGSSIMSIGVKSLDSSSAEDKNAFTEKKDVEIILLTDTGKTTRQLLTELLKDENVLYAEPDYISRISETEPEPNYAELYGDITNTQWGFHNDGTIMNTENSTLKDFAVNPTDWNNPEKENATGVIAFIYSGINYDHPDLKNIIVDNMDEYNPIGGKYGYAPCKEDVTDPMDDNGHGTHCAGIAAAEWNDFGISGAASGCKVAALKAGNADGHLMNSNVIKCYQYLSTAIDNGLEVIAVSNSWGGILEDCAQSLNICITEIGRKGAISIFVAGNDSSDCDIVYDTPASISMNPYVVTVGASSPYGDSATFSNYGETSVDIFAPGVGIMSTYYNNDEEYVFETDKSPLLTEDFSDKNSDIDFVGKDGKPINYWFDEKINFDGNSSLAFKLSDCEEIIKEETGEVRKKFKVFVPIDKEGHL